MFFGRTLTGAAALGGGRAQHPQARRDAFRGLTQWVLPQVGFIFGFGVRKLSGAFARQA